MAKTRVDATAGEEDALLLHGTAMDFGRFYALYEAYVLGLFMHRGMSADAAADMTAETFARALEARRRFDPARGNGRAWLTGIARHVIAESIRAGRTEDRVRRRLGLERLEFDDGAIQRIEESSQEALAALSILPEDQRIAVTERIIHGEDYERLADRLRCSHTVIRQRVSRGIRSLRVLLRNEL